MFVLDKVATDIEVLMAADLNSRRCNYPWIFADAFRVSSPLLAFNLQVHHHVRGGLIWFSSQDLLLTFTGGSIVLGANFECDVMGLGLFHSESHRRGRA